MTRIAQFMPRPKVRQIDRVAVRASPEITWLAVRNLDTFDVPFFRTLVSLRVAPERLIARLGGRDEVVPRHSRLDDIVAPGHGFILLDEEPGREIVIGAIGKFWRPTIEWLHADPVSFASFGCAGWAKIVWNLRVDPRDAGGSWINCEVRVDANDDVSWRRFRAFWLVVGPLSHWLRKTGLGVLQRKLGAPRASDLRFDDATATPLA